MEIYTTDLIDIAQRYAGIISKALKCEGNYIVEDECCNLQREIRNILHERLSKAFEELIHQEAMSDIERSYLLYQEGGLLDKLFKIINEL
jgi:hypothetical protein